MHLIFLFIKIKKIVTIILRLGLKVLPTVNFWPFCFKAICVKDLDDYSLKASCPRYGLKSHEDSATFCSNFLRKKIKTTAQQTTSYLAVHHVLPFPFSKPVASLAFAK